jgi:membrane fusion protein, multidrug efflux system
MSSRSNESRPRPALLAALLALPLLLAACGREAPSPRAGGKGEAAPVLAAQATREDVPVTLRTIGTVEPYRTVAVRARVTGTLTGVRFREGEEVARGEPLFAIDARPYEVALRAAEANLAQEEAKATLAALDAQRSTSLAAQSLVSRQEHERVAAAAAAESAAVAARTADVENARLNLEFCTIAAPIAGRTSNLLVHEGNLVRSNDTQALVVINQISPAFVSFSIPESALPEVQQRMAEGGGLGVEAAPPGAAGPPAGGTLTFVNNAVDPATGTILLKAEFPNRDRALWPGEFVQVTVTLTTRTGALVVPASAIQAGQQGDYVLVVQPDMTAVMRPVEVGLRLEGRAIIESGLEPGETVVTDGQLRVVPGGKVVIKSGLDSPAAPAR